MRFLLREKAPSPEVISAIRSAVAWLKKVPLRGVRIDNVEAPKEEFLRQTVTFDKVVVADPAAPRL